MGVSESSTIGTDPSESGWHACTCYSHCSVHRQPAQAKSPSEREISLVVPLTMQSWTRQGIRASQSIDHKTAPERRSTSPTCLCPFGNACLPSS